MTKKKNFKKTDVYQIITDQVIAKLEEGVVPWKKPWKVQNGEVPMNFVSKRAYRGLNVLLLDMQGYESNYWLSFKQAKDLGGKVRKGEKGTPIIFWKRIKITEEDERTGEEKKKTIPLLKHFTIFNIEQCEGIELPEQKEEPKEEFNSIEEAERIVEGYQGRPDIKFGGDRACYSPMADKVSMPHKENFHGNEEFYSTLFHELVHSTGHQKRLNRESVANPKMFGSHQYSKEELIAELGNCFLCSECGIETTFDNSAAYIKNWLQVLKDDKKMIIQAASKATKATKHILGIEEGEQETEQAA